MQAPYIFQSFLQWLVLLLGLIALTPCSLYSGLMKVQFLYIKMLTHWLPDFYFIPACLIFRFNVTIFCFLSFQKKGIYLEAYVFKYGDSTVHFLMMKAYFG